MWIAQWPDGTWCSYKEKPREKMGGWDGECHAILMRRNHLISWRQSLREVPENEYLHNYLHKELRRTNEI